MEPILELKNANKIYDQTYVKTVGLQGINLKIYPSEFVCITGQSGCGKSTLLNILGAIDDLSSGSYLFEGVDVTRLNDHQSACFRNEKVGMVFQSFNLINEISALENVCMPLGYAGMARKQREKHARELLDLVALSQKADKLPIYLSGGEQQRVAIARALAKSPRVLLADEPTGNLDRKNSLSIMELFSQLHTQGMTIVMVTHSDEVASYAMQQWTSRLLWTLWRLLRRIGTINIPRSQSRGGKTGQTSAPTSNILRKSAV